MLCVGFLKYATARRRSRRLSASLNTAAVSHLTNLDSTGMLAAIRCREIDELVGAGENAMRKYRPDYGAPDC